MKHHWINWAVLFGLILPCCLVQAQDDIDLSFARQKIAEAIREKRLPNLPIQFELDTDLLTEAYRIKPGPGGVIIYGGDGKGLLYGGLEVAEQLQLKRQIKLTEGKPYLAKRGFKFNIPLDARTPSYDDSGDAAQKNILEMWNFAFWQEFLDEMALHRYNTLTLWNPHPFPSMIKMEEYPDVALDDVKITTLSPVGRENEWGDPQLVTANVMDNLKTVKEVSIDEKIIFWQSVMQLAKSRGIDIYFITWNICPNSVANPVEPFHKTFGIKLWDEKPGKYGISHQMNNPKTIAYYRKAVKTFLLTYPHVKGIGVTAGEYMPPTWDGYNREQWLWETYGLGILDAKEVQPDREVPFIHRVWYSDMDQIMKYWKQYPDPFEVSFKYAKARLYSSPEPPFAQSHLKEMEPYGLKSWWNLRNDDIFVYRWGDADYVRKFLKFFPRDQTAGYYYGSDGYVWGREFISKHPELSGQLEVKKHWYNTMLWGRLGYNPDLSRDFFIQKIGHHFADVPAAELHDLWQKTSTIIPSVNTFHWRNWDHMWSPEACLARPVLGGFREVTDFIDNPTMEGSNLQNPRAYVRNMMAKRKSDKVSPLDFAQQLRLTADASISDAKAMKQTSDLSPETSTLLDDIEAMGHLGNYYAVKIEAAVALAFYLEKREDNQKKKAIELLEQGLVHWLRYADVSVKNYHSQMLARTNLLDWKALVNEVKEDISKTKKIKY